jgi:hypothetical protein
VHAAKQTNICSLGGAPAPKNEKQTGRIHVAIQSVHAVKPSLSKHGQQTGRIRVAMQSVHAVKPRLQEAHKKPARAFMQPRKPIRAARESHLPLRMKHKLAAYM